MSTLRYRTEREKALQEFRELELKPLKGLTAQRDSLIKENRALVKATLLDVPNPEAFSELDLAQTGTTDVDDLTQVEMFLATEPTYYSCKENAAMLMQVIRKNKLACTVYNLHVAFDWLNHANLLVRDPKTQPKRKKAEAAPVVAEPEKPEFGHTEKPIAVDEDEALTSEQIKAKYGLKRRNIYGPVSGGKRVT